jgi:opacity protein-like surface antigen
MDHFSLRRRSAVLMFAAALSGVALAGCGQAAETAIEQAAEQAIGGDVAIDDGQVSVTDDEGNTTVVGEDVELPEEWPTVIPVPAGAPLMAASVDAEGKAVTSSWMGDPDPAVAAEAYGQQLLDAGFELDSTGTAPGLNDATYLGNGYQVSVRALELDESSSMLMVMAFVQE